MRLHIFSADKEDIRKGWIRVSEKTRGYIPSASYVRIKANGRTIYCQIRGTNKGEGLIEINEWYRSLLGWDNTPESADFEFKQVGLSGRLHALSMHPDDIVRIGTGLGLLSVGLGLLSVFFTTVSASISLFGGEDFEWGLAGLVVSLFMMFFVGYLIMAGVSIFARTPKVVKRKKVK